MSQYLNEYLNHIEVTAQHGFLGPNNTCLGQMLRLAGQVLGSF